MKMLMINFPQKMVCMILYVCIWGGRKGELGNHVRKLVSIILFCNDFLQLKHKRSYFGDVYYQIIFLRLMNNHYDRAFQILIFFLRQETPLPQNVCL